MNAEIQERSFSLRSEYDISAAGSKFHAVKAFFSLGNNLQLESESGSVIAKMVGRFALLHSEYDFEFTDGRKYNFKHEKLWKGVWACEGNGESFHLYEHKGLRYSIFKGDSQIAAYTKNRVTFGSGNTYHARINSDADLVLILCMILSVNTSEDDNNDSTVNVDLGNIGPEERPFDDSWEPNE